MDDKEIVLKDEFGEMTIEQYKKIKVEDMKEGAIDFLIKKARASERQRIKKELDKWFDECRNNPEDIIKFYDEDWENFWEKLKNE